MSLQATELVLNTDIQIGRSSALAFNCIPRTPWTNRRLAEQTTFWHRALCLALSNLSVQLWRAFQVQNHGTV